jgi:RNA polymerase sigma-70 factor (ECF subfamily)
MTGRAAHDDDARGRSDVDVDRFRSADPTYFRTIVERHSPMLLALARGFARDADEAHDLVQEAWVRAYERRATYLGTGSFAAWLWAVCRSVCASRARHATARAVAHRAAGEDLARTAAGAHAVDGAHERLEAAERRHRVHAALARLTERQREVVLMRLMDGRSTRETADALGCAEGTVKATLHQALARLEQLLKENGT